MDKYVFAQEREEFYGIQLQGSKASCCYAEGIGSGFFRYSFILFLFCESTLGSGDPSGAHLTFNKYVPFMN